MTKGVGEDGEEGVVQIFGCWNIESCGSQRGNI